MTNENVDARELLSKVLAEGSGDFLLQVLAEGLRHVMEAEVSALCRAGYRERSPERAVSRNGYRSRALETRMGTVALEVPKVRRGSYFPSFLEPRRRWEKAFHNVVCEAYVLGGLDPASGGAGGGHGGDGDEQVGGVADGRDAGRAGRRLPRAAPR